MVVWRVKPTRRFGKPMVGKPDGRAVSGIFREFGGLGEGFIAGRDFWSRKRLKQSKQGSTFSCGENWYRGGEGLPNPQTHVNTLCTKVFRLEWGFLAWWFGRGLVVVWWLNPHWGRESVKTSSF